MKGWRGLLVQINECIEIWKIECDFVLEINASYREVGPHRGALHLNHFIFVRSHLILLENVSVAFLVATRLGPQVA